MHIAIPELKILGAVTSRGATSGSGNTAINGTDMNPPNWDCPPVGSTAAGMVVNDSATNATTTGGCSGAACLTGSPKIKDSTALVRLPLDVQYDPSRLRIPVRRPEPLDRRRVRDLPRTRR